MLLPESIGIYTENCGYVRLKKVSGKKVGKYCISSPNSVSNKLIEEVIDRIIKSSVILKFYGLNKRTNSLIIGLKRR